MNFESDGCWSEPTCWTLLTGFSDCKFKLLSTMGLLDWNDCGDWNSGEDKRGPARLRLAADVAELLIVYTI